MQTSSKQKSLFINLLCNIIIPTLILNKMGQYTNISTTCVLLIALAFPLFYGLHDFFQQGKANGISILGIINILLSGGFALLKFEGLWFAVKEATIPGLIGLAVLISAFTSKPLIAIILNTPNFLNKNLVEQQVKRLQREETYQNLLSSSTLYFSLSFFLSALINYCLARKIFTPLSETLSSDEKAKLLNEQIAAMTWQGYLIIALPMTLVMGCLIWYIFHRLKAITELPSQELFPALRGSTQSASSEHKDS